MHLEFTSFYSLKDLARPKVSGELCHSWNTQYARVRVGSRFIWTPEQNGSGYQLSDVSMRDALPPDVARICKKTGIIYILVSSRYDILYVGISRKQMAGGVFNGGRFVHHLRKFMASSSIATSHPGFWQDHARVRYVDARALEIGDHNNFWSDLMISFAHDPEAHQHEGTVLDKVRCDMRRYEKMPLILNNGAVKRERCEVSLPANCPWRGNSSSEEVRASLTCVVKAGGLDEQTANVLSTSVLSPIPGADEVEEGADDLDQPLTIADEYPDLKTAMSRENWSTFEKLIEWARQLNVGKRIEERRRIYGRGQPPGYNNQPVVTFACFHPSGTAVKNQWLCRIPISARQLTIILPKKYIGSRCDEAEISLGNNANFCPVSVHDFLSDPEKYFRSAGMSFGG